MKYLERQGRSMFVLVTAAALALCCSGYDTNSLVTVRMQDTGETLINPGMGLVHYHYSNRLWAYGMYSNPGDTDPLPGTSVVYMREEWPGFYYDKRSERALWYRFRDMQKAASQNK